MNLKELKNKHEYAFEKLSFLQRGYEDYEIKINFIMGLFLASTGVSILGAVYSFVSFVQLLFGKGFSLSSLGILVATVSFSFLSFMIFKRGEKFDEAMKNKVSELKELITDEFLDDLWDCHLSHNRDFVKSFRSFCLEVKKDSFDFKSFNKKFKAIVYDIEEEKIDMNIFSKLKAEQKPYELEEDDGKEIVKFKT